MRKILLCKVNLNSCASIRTLIKSATAKFSLRQPDKGSLQAELAFQESGDEDDAYISG